MCDATDARPENIRRLEVHYSNAFHFSHRSYGTKRRNILNLLLIKTFPVHRRDEFEVECEVVVKSVKLSEILKVVLSRTESAK